MSSSTALQQEESTLTVQVAVYDLSKGMARPLSAQFLGPNHVIDAIPHTGLILNYTTEYFFGAGIQSEDPAAFRRATGMSPMQILDFGPTRVTQAQFEAWCRQKMDSGEFDMASYDLLTHNCNTFVHVALTQGLGLTTGLPAWILDVPRKFLSSPMGQLVRPMLDNMQLGQVSGAQSMSLPTPLFANAAPPVATTNPWANMSSSSTAKEKNPPAGEAATKAPSTTTSAPCSLEILNAHTKPLLANETKTVPLVVKSLASLATQQEQANDLKQVGQALQQQQTLPADQMSRVVAFLLQCLEQGQKTTFALMLLRLLVLQQHAAVSCQPCVQWMVTALSSGELLQAAASRAMAWLTLSNVVATVAAAAAAASASNNNNDFMETNLECLVEQCVSDISPETQARAEVRQAAAAFLYNTVVSPTMQRGLVNAQEELLDIHVSILCACLDSLDREVDDTVALRRIAAAARILLPTIANNDEKARNQAVARLISDLGFQEGLQAFAQQQPATKSAKLSNEVLFLLRD